MTPSQFLLSRDVNELLTWVHTNDHPHGKHRPCRKFACCSNFPHFAHLPESACFLGLKTFFSKLFCPQFYDHLLLAESAPKPFVLPQATSRSPEPSRAPVFFRASGKISPVVSERHLHLHEFFLFLQLNHRSLKLTQPDGWATLKITLDGRKG